MAPLLNQLYFNSSLFSNMIFKRISSFHPINAQYHTLSRGGYARIKRKYKERLVKVEMPESRKLKATADSYAARGFLRATNSYTPPEDVEARLSKIIQNTSSNFPNSGLQRFELLDACSKEFNHPVPNSIMHTIKSFNDLRSFYLTPVDCTLPLDRLKSQPDLPPNLHVQTEPLRFLPNEDTMFKGQTAFPQSNTIVTGLRSKRKYKGHDTTEPWKDPHAPPSK